jgi:hypothetical protein
MVVAEVGRVCSAFFRVYWLTLQNIAMIVPPPMCGMHDMYLKNFVETGQSVRASRPLTELVCQPLGLRSAAS